VSAPNDYQFVTRWRVEGTCGEVADIFDDPLSLARWWPSVYLDVREAPPANGGSGRRRIAVHTKGWLPYTLRWEFEVVESRYPYGLTLIAHGDFEGRGIWEFRQDGRFVEATYDWQLRAEKPILRNLSFLLKPIFEANHRWAMARGEESLRLELLRRRATSDAVRAGVASPPGPVTYAGVAVIAGVVAVGVAVGFLIVRSRKQV